MYLKRMTLTNFKGIANATFDFDSKESFIHGRNGSGKTSLNDADLWLKFGKDHLGRNDYQLKKYKSDGEITHRLACEVEGVYDIDGVELLLKRVYKEKWVKPKTMIEEVFESNMTEYYIDNCEVKKSEYDAKIESLCDQQRFRVITNPSYFPSLKPDAQRDILYSMVSLSDDDIAGKNADFKKLLLDASGASFEAFRKTINAKKLKLKNELADLQPRVDELVQHMPEMPNLKAIEADIEKKKARLVEIESELSDIATRMSSANKGRMEFQGKINELKLSLQKFGFDEETKRKEAIALVRTGLAKMQETKTEAARTNNSKAITKHNLTSEKVALEQDLGILRTEYKKINAESLVFPDGTFDCPTCKRPLDISDIESKQAELTSNFNTAKAKRLTTNIGGGKGKVTRVAEIVEALRLLEETPDIDILEMEDAMLKVATTLSELQAAIGDYKMSDGYLTLEKEIEDLQADLDAPTQEQTTDDIKAEKVSVGNEIDALKSKIALKGVIQNTNTRIKQIQGMITDASQLMADLEKQEFTIKNFEFAKSTEYQKRINEMFKFTKFRLFKQQVDGQIVPDFECMVDGVPYGTLNNAMQIGAGLDIIDAISRFYNVFAPIWLDNRESITSIPEMDAQIINLVVDKGYSELEIVEH